MDTVGEENNRRRKEKVVFLTSGGEATKPENMEALYASVWSWFTEEEDGTLLPNRKGVDEYQDPVDPSSLSDNFAAMFTEVASLLNPRVELPVILIGITQDNNEVLEDEIKETVKFHRLERSMEEAVSTFQSVVEEEQRNGGPQQKLPLAENENLTSRSNQEQGIDIHHET